MKKRGILAALVVLGGCQTGSLPSAYKAGSTGSERQYAFDQCKIASLKEIPQAIATDYNPGYQNPGTLQCNTFGNSTSCYRVGAVNIPASSSNYDANADLRYRYVQRCMQSKGYTFKTVPTCVSPEKRKKAYSQPQPSSPSEFTCNAGTMGTF